MPTPKNINKKLSEADLLQLICYNLAQFSYARKRFASLKNETDYNEFLNTLVERIQQIALGQAKEIKQLTDQKKKETDSKKLAEIENKLQEFSKLPYSPTWVAGSETMARCAAKSLILLGDFEIILGNQKQQARPIDSVAKTNLFGSNKEIKEFYSTHYQEKYALGPLIHSLSCGTQANQDRLEALFSLAKPKTPVRHQIWINDHLMLQSNLLTDQSLYDFLNQDQKRIGDVFYLVAYAEEIEKKANGNLTQEFINSQLKQMRMEHLKREGEKYMEQFALITVELFGQLIKRRKKNSPATVNSGLYDKLNDIIGITAPFSNNDVAKMKEYLRIRDDLAHPTEYNLRPMGDDSHPDLLADFKDDMVSYIANLLNINPNDILNQISQIKEEETFNVNALITLMDTRKALRDICVKEENLPDNAENVFESLKFIDANENQILTDAVDLRNRLCHSKIDSAFAMQAEEKAIAVWPVINKIATNVDKKYGVTLKNYYQNTAPAQTKSLSDFQQEFPFINTSFETDPDKKLFIRSVKKATNNPIVDKELLEKLYTFSLVTYHFIKGNDGKKTCPYIDSEFSPFYQEIDYLGKNPDSNVLPNLKQLISKGILKAFEKGYPLPTLKSENQKN